MDAKQSPLFQPVLWQDPGFKILDETLLPWRTEYIEVRDLSQALAAVKDMKTRAFGQVLTFFYAAALVARCENSLAGLRRRMSRLGEEFTEVRPTFDFKGLAGYFEPWFDQPPDGDTGSWFEGKVHEFIAGIMKMRLQRAKFSAELLPARCRLLTHCNVSGELVAVAQACRDLGKELTVIATETRPYLQGSRLTAWELNQAGVNVEVIPDGAVAQVIAANKVDAVLVGADRVARNGDIINKVGTYPIAVVAARYGVPFYVLVQDPGTLQSGGDVDIEERPAAELFQLQGESLLEAPVEGRYPAFDMTPARLIARLITFGGAHTPEEFRQKYRPESPSRAIEKKSADHILIYGVPKRAEFNAVARTLKLEKAAHILAAEMRPELSGLEVVAKELTARNIPVEIISDNMMGTFFAQGAIRRLYLFYSEIGSAGPVGICGSLLAALLARAHGVPIELLAGDAAVESVDRDISTFIGRRVVPDGVKIYPVEKEVIPWSLFKENGGA
jgi:methylthioribose-1-phosphate isomerase